MKSEDRSALNKRRRSTVKRQQKSLSRLRKHNKNVPEKENLNNNGEKNSTVFDDDNDESKQLSKISAHYFFLPSFCPPNHRWILTWKTSTITSQHSSRALWEFRCRRTLSWGLHCTSCQRAIVTRARVALSLIVYQTAVRFSRQTQISSHRIQFQPPCQPAISSASTRERAIWPYRSISTLKPHNVIRWL